MAEERPKLRLYSSWISSCAFRVRIALNLKGLKFENVAVDLLKGEQRTPEFLRLNPIGFVPVLVDEDIVLADSLAILLYLDEKYPQYPLLPTDIRRKAINLQAANIVCSSIQPLQSLTLLKYIEEKISSEERVIWAEKHIGKGFAALEELLKDYAGRYATGDEIQLADLFLAPQIWSAFNRFKLDMGLREFKNREVTNAVDQKELINLTGMNWERLSKYPLLSRLHESYIQLPAYQNAMPENQPDNPSRNI